MNKKLSRLYDFTAGQIARSSQVDAEFDQIIAMFNSFVGVAYDGVTQSAVEIDGDSVGEYVLSELAEAVTFNEPSGDPYDGQPLVVAIKDDGTARGITFNSTYFTWITTQVTSTIANKWVYIGLKYRLADLKWHIVAVRQQP